MKYRTNKAKVVVTFAVTAGVRQRCWWLYDGDSFLMLVKESLSWWRFVIFIIILTCHQHKLSSTSVTNIDRETLTTRILMTDVGDEMCWWQLWGIVDGLAVFVANIVYLSTLASSTKIRKMLSISNFCHQHPEIVTNIYMYQNFSTCHQHLYVSKFLNDFLRSFIF